MPQATVDSLHNPSDTIKIMLGEIKLIYKANAQCVYSINKTRAELYTIISPRNWDPQSESL